MATPSRTQKQIAERYKGNLGYYRRLHPWRRTRLIVSLITLFGGLLAIFLFRYYGHETFFNAGKIATAFQSNVDWSSSLRAARSSRRNFRGARGGASPFTTRFALWLEKMS